MSYIDDMEAQVRAELASLTETSADDRRLDNLMTVLGMWVDARARQAVDPDDG